MRKDVFDRALGQLDDGDGEHDQDGDFNHRQAHERFLPQDFPRWAMKPTAAFGAFADRPEIPMAASLAPQVKMFATTAANLGRSWVLVAALGAAQLQIGRDG